MAEKLLDDELPKSKAIGAYNNISYLNVHRVLTRRFTVTIFGDQCGHGIFNPFDLQNGIF